MSQYDQSNQSLGEKLAVMIGKEVTRVGGYPELSKSILHANRFREKRKQLTGKN